MPELVSADVTIPYLFVIPTSARGMEEESALVLAPAKQQVPRRCAPRNDNVIGVVKAPHVKKF